MYHDGGVGHTTYGWIKRNAITLINMDLKKKTSVKGEAAKDFNV
jgi:hypothetical protein